MQKIKEKELTVRLANIKNANTLWKRANDMSVREKLQKQMTQHKLAKITS